ncbi:penicillin-binding protein 2 [Nocardioides islandensis]|uniref:Penicillin-binding protein 2 n=1 Tax=Nocardioides islandensis TaxID=433663 RepID=A0A930YEJ9_9ACTN|nr:penicillin-binding protein 2 [Nocardioides islandensis]MBF4763813.1 penicillin-binding protein 2 [Nocardioides islandensis]
MPTSLSGPASRPQTRRRGSLRGSPQLRLRFGFVVIAMVLSLFGARLVQLQGVDPEAYAAMAAAEGTTTIDLPAERGDILDRNGRPIADSVDGEMVVANPEMTRAQAPELAKFLSSRLDIDYFTTLKALRQKDRQFAYIARRVPASKAEDVVAAAKAAGYDGLDTRHDPVRDYPAGDVAANLVGFLGIDEPLAGFEATFDKQLAGKDGLERYAVGNGNRIPLGRATLEPAVNGQDLHTTIDLDLQWYVQRVLRQTREDARADSAFAVVMDTRTGEVLALGDDPTFDARNPQAAPKRDRVSRAMTDVYEPGSVEKVLTLSALIDAGKATMRTRVTVPPSLPSGDRVIHDWFGHGTLHMTLAGVIAQSSNIGTVLASRNFETGQLREYLTEFGLGQRTNVGVAGETQGILPDPSIWTSMTQDRIAFGQSLSVNALQMAAAVNTIANGGVRVSPSLVQGSATTNDGTVVGTDTTTEQRVVSKRAAHQMALMMERVVDPDVGVAPAAQIPGYRVAGKTGTAQRVGPRCGCYNGTFTVSFAGFAPADKPRFTVYVVVQNPRNGGGGGSVGGPAFAKIMSYALRRYGVPPTGTAPSHVPTTWRPGQVASPNG